MNPSEVIAWVMVSAVAIFMVCFIAVTIKATINMFRKKD